MSLTLVEIVSNYPVMSIKLRCTIPPEIKDAGHGFLYVPGSKRERDRRAAEQAFLKTRQWLQKNLS